MDIEISDVGKKVHKELGSLILKYFYELFRNSPRIYASLHTNDPLNFGMGFQSDNEVKYRGYKRVALNPERFFLEPRNRRVIYKDAFQFPKMDKGQTIAGIGLGLSRTGKGTLLVFIRVRHKFKSGAIPENIEKTLTFDLNTHLHE